MLRFNASSVPILQISLSSRTLSEADVYDYAMWQMRQKLLVIRGLTIPTPYGGLEREVMVDLDPQLLRARGVSAKDVADAINAYNLAMPTGVVRIDALQYPVTMNNMPLTAAAFNDIPIKQAEGVTVYLRDVAQVRDGYNSQTTVVRRDGHRGALVTILKNGGASTLEIIRQVKEMMPTLRASAPKGLDIELLFDQSLFVQAAVDGVVHESVLAALLTATTILIFLGSWRSTLVVAVSIPLSILCSLVGLYALGNTLNVMTLGGLALAVGILVDDATVEIENIHRNLAMGKPLKQAILDGAQQIAGPTFVSTLTICAVFVSVVFLDGPPRYLFTPMAMAVVFAMLASYLLSRTLVPVMVHYLLPAEIAAHAEHRAGGEGFFARFHRGFEQGFTRLRDGYVAVLTWNLHHGRSVLVLFLAAVASGAALLPHVGQDFFPVVDAGQIRLHVRVPAGTRLERTQDYFNQVENEIRRIIPPEEIESVINNIGLPNRTYSMAFGESATTGMGDGEILIALAHRRSRSTPEYVAELRRELPKKFAECTFFFQSADIVSQILNFGLPAPIDVQVTGNDRTKNQDLASRIAGRIRAVRGVQDVHMHQVVNVPTLHVEVDQTRTAQLGLTQLDVANNVLVSLSGSGQVMPNYWVDPANGLSYLVETRTPLYRVESAAAIELDPDSHQRPTRAAAPRKPSQDRALDQPGSDQSREHPARLRHLRQRARNGPWQRGQAGGPDPRRVSGRAFAGKHDRHAGPGGEHAIGVPAARVRAGFLRRAGVSADGRQFPVLARPVHHHHGPSRGPGRNRLDAVCHRHDLQRAEPDGGDHGHRRCHRQQHPGRDLRQRPATRRNGRLHGSRRGRPNSHAARVDDGPGDGRRHAPHVVGPWRGRRTERAARPRGDRGAGRRHRRHPAIRSFGLQRAAATCGAAAGRSRGVVPMEKRILALDQGTTSSRAMVFGRDGRPVAVAQEEFAQILPASGVVEHDPEVLWASQLRVAREALARSSLDAAQIAAIGIANQRETTILWDRDTGRPVANAIVWQSRVSALRCDRLKAEGLGPLFSAKTGLMINAYFSGTKISHLLDACDGLRSRAARGEILFGTVDTWLVWRLTGGRRHMTDYTNASRTLIFNIHTLDWDDELLEILDIPRAMLPEVRPSSEVYGETSAEWFGRAIPIAGNAGDQQAAAFGQACFQPGAAKNTYGTGCFMLMNTGAQPVPSQHNLLTTILWGLEEGRVVYGLEGSVFIAGAAVQWLRNGLGIIKSSAEVGELAGSVADNGGVYFVPALAGLGAPYWDPYARGTIVGISRATKAAHIARAALEAIAYQTQDLAEAMRKDARAPLAELKVDGGAAVNDLLMQFQADLLGVDVLRPVVAETTALGAAHLAGLAVGFWHDTADLSARWALDRRFAPQLSTSRREALCRRWRQAVERSRDWEEHEFTESRNQTKGVTP